MHFIRRFTTSGRGLDSIEMVSMKCEILGLDGTASFSMDEVLAPKDWSINAVNVVAQKYLRKAGVPNLTVRVLEPGVPEWAARSVPAEGAVFGAEKDIRKAIHRMAGTWAYWGFKTGVFDSDEQGLIFYDEVCFSLLRQMWAPNSPQWFNTGLHWAYGIEGPPQGHFYFDDVAGEVVRSTSAYERPQPHACFIQSVDDDLVNEGGIMDLFNREARLFKYGSGTGSNFSNLRARGERLSGGGYSSGVLSWLRIGDRAAQGIQSGGTTRRAAKMVVLDVDHPEISEFVNWKVTEEQKVAAMVAGSHVCERSLNRIFSACQGEASFDPKLNSALADAILEAREAFVPDTMIYRVIEFARQGVSGIEFPIFDTDWQGEAYDTVAGQQSNNSIAVSHEFLRAVEADADWSLTRRTDGGVERTMRARDLWDEMTYAAWACADPGLQFNSTMNEWHTCSNDEAIRATNPCSEYVFIDDTACNLASINLVLFDSWMFGRSVFQVDDFVHVVHLITTVLDISVSMSQLPSAEIAEKTYWYRTLGLGYANLGALLMRRGLPYDSDGGRALAAAITSLMTGEAYVQSAKLASRCGAFPRFEQNRNVMLGVIRHHMLASRSSSELKTESSLTITPPGLDHHPLVDASLIHCARDAWDRALQLGAVHGYRNAQVTVIAPTGTIAIAMDCDTTGVEPDFSLVKYKSLAGGGGMTIINQSVPQALRSLGYSDSESDSIVKHIHGHRSLSVSLKRFLASSGFTREMLDAVSVALVDGPPHITMAISEAVIGSDNLILFTSITGEDLASGKDVLTLLGRSADDIHLDNLYSVGAMTIEGAPHLKEEHLPVFDCANRCGVLGKRFISADGHLRMMGAIQPFVSGAISKTVNMPRDATIQDVRDTYMKAWKLGLKAIAIYRDGSKLSQPLGSRLSAELFSGLEKSRPEDAPGVIHKISERLVIRYLSERRKLPFQRRGYTQKAIIGGHKVFLRTGEYEDGSLGEIFIDTHKDGAAFRSLLAAFAMAVSVGIQHGVPLEKLVDLYTFTQYEPNGMVMGDVRIKNCTSLLDWVFRHLAVSYLGREDLAHVKGQPGTFEAEPSWSHERDAASTDLRDEDTSEVDVVKTFRSTSSSMSFNKMTPEEIAQSQGYTGDTCGNCGQVKLVRTNGNCTHCLGCGSSGGCS